MKQGEQSEGASAAQWGPAPNPWHGIVQAWPMPPWRPSVLGSRPGVSPPQAMAAFSAPPSSDAAYYAGNTTTIPAGLYSALNGMSINNSGGGGNDWFFDTGASAHMASNSGILSSPPEHTVARQIIVGNGHHLET